MKTIIKFATTTNLLGTVAILVCGINANAQYNNPFDTASSPLRYDFGNAVSPTATLASGPTYDAGSSPISGSAKLSWSWAGTVGGANFTADIFGAPTDCSGATLSFDIYVDPSSTPGNYSDYGYFQFNTRNGNGYSYGPSYVNSGLVGSGNIVGATGQWAHVSVALGADASTLRAVTFQDYNDAGRGPITGLMTIYIDNLNIIPVPEPATLSLCGVGILSLCALGRRKST